MVEPQLPRSVPCPIAFVGEAPGEDEERFGRPFVGRSGELFNRALALAGIDRYACLVTNVFDERLPGNDVKRICQRYPDADATWRQIEMPVDHGAYLPPSIGVPALDRLWKELDRVQPRVVVAMGQTAAWALFGIRPGTMKRARGPTGPTMMVPLKGIITWHPAHVQRQYQELPYLVGDLIKARRESAFPEYRPPELEVIVPPPTQEGVDQAGTYLLDSRGLTAVDIETRRGRIDCIGFASSPTRALCVPVRDPNTMEPYWPEDLAHAISRWVALFLESTRPKVMQNGNYDEQWIYERWGVVVRGRVEDTRLLHHALWPELPKDLGTMASIHLDMPGWKMSRGGRTDKKDD